MFKNTLTYFKNYLNWGKLYECSIINKEEKLSKFLCVTIVNLKQASNVVDRSI